MEEEEFFGICFNCSGMEWLNLDNGQINRLLPNGETTYKNSKYKIQIINKNIVCTSLTCRNQKMILISFNIYGISERKIIYKMNKNERIKIARSVLFEGDEE